MGGMDMVSRWPADVVMGGMVVGGVVVGCMVMGGVVTVGYDRGHQVGSGRGYGLGMVVGGVVTVTRWWIWSWAAGGRQMWLWAVWFW